MSLAWGKWKQNFTKLFVILSLFPGQIFKWTTLFSLTCQDIYSDCSSRHIHRVQSGLFTQYSTPEKILIYFHFGLSQASLLFWRDFLGVAVMKTLILMRFTHSFPLKTLPFYLPFISFKTLSFHTKWTCSGSSELHFKKKIVNILFWMVLCRLPISI